MGKIERDEKLQMLLEKAKHVRMTEKEQADQRRSFAFGNSAFENPLITKSMIEKEEKKLQRA